MEIPVQPVSMAKDRCGQTKHQKYGKYMKVLEDKPEILEYLFGKIDESPSKEILVKAVDMVPALGSYFTKTGETALYWGLKYSMFNHAIFVTTTKSLEINPNTREGYLLLRMRRAKPGDVLPDSLAKYLEPADVQDADSTTEQCGTTTYLL